MGWSRLGPAVLLAASTVACGSDATDEPDPPDPPDSCEPPTVELPDGSCLRPGILPESCAPGFEPTNASGCEPILPAELCPPGLMAVPGDAACRPVMPCGEGTWGDIPVDATTQYVDAGYTGGASDGSAAAPWTTIGQAYAAVAPGGLIAVAAGSYAEDVFIYGKPARVLGVCPELVEITGAGGEPAAVIFGVGVDGSTLEGVAIQSVNTGIISQGSLDVTVDRVWIHDSQGRGLAVEDYLGPTRLVLRNSLIESNVQLGLFAFGSEIVVESSHVRTTVADALDPTSGRGLNAQLFCTPQDGCDPAKPSAAQITGSHFEQNVQAGILAFGSQVSVDSTVVRDTLVHPANGRGGVGIAAQSPCVPGAGCTAAAPALLTVDRSVVQRNNETGIAVAASTAVIRDTVVSGTRATDDSGAGIMTQPICLNGTCDISSVATSTVQNVLVTDNEDVGLLAVGAHLDVFGTIVRDQRPVSSGASGRGIAIQPCIESHGCTPILWGTGSIRDSLVEGTHELGVNVISSDSTLERLVVRSVAPSFGEGLFGDGVVILPLMGTVTVRQIWVDGAARASLANFGATVSLQDNRFSCSPLHLVAESVGTLSPVYEDLGDNLCGCPATETCKVSTVELVPPEPLDPPLSP